MARPRTSVSEAIIGRNLRILRESRGITLKDMAARLGVTYQQVQKYEKGESALSCARLHDACTALGVSCDAFFETAPERPALGNPAINPAIMARALKLQRIGNPAQRAKILKIIDILTA